jgi:hypothetical protein
LATDLVVEYWLFYDYDDWQANTAIAPIQQQHAADWEMIALGFAKRHSAEAKTAFRPLWAAYSAHCGGSWLPWSAVPRDGDHPLVWVAHGSHANYPNRRARSPNWASCVKPAALDRYVDIASFSASVVETLPEKTARPVVPKVVGSSEGRQYLSKLNPLGFGETISLLGWKTGATERGATTENLEPGHSRQTQRGIESPLDPRRSISRRPIETIFGERTFWHCRAVAQVCRRPR